MAEVAVQVNGRTYTVGCEDGQEEHLKQLAAIFDEQVSQVAGAVGQLGDNRLFMMSALLLADELSELRGRLAEAQSELARRQVARTRGDLRAVAALENAAKRIEALAGKG